MFNSRYYPRSRLPSAGGIGSRAAVNPAAPDREQIEAILALNRQHVAAISRLLSIMDLTRKAAADSGPQPRLRDTCKAKAEILLSSEETDTLRSHLVAPNRA